MSFIKLRKKRVPKLSFTKSRNIGWYVSYRESANGQPRKHRFGLVARSQAELAYHTWVADHLQGKTTPQTSESPRPRRKIDFAIMPDAVALAQHVDEAKANAQIPSTGGAIAGSLAHVASGLLRFEEARTREFGEARRRGSIERYGETPPLVWSALIKYLKETPRADGELLFVTRKGMPLVHANADSVQLWWYALRKTVGETGKTMGGFYTLRHLGATEFGSRPGCSISAVKRWLGHGASSQMADTYMKPINPQNREVIEFVRKALSSGVIPATQ